MSPLNSIQHQADMMNRTNNTVSLQDMEELVKKRNGNVIHLDMLKSQSLRLLKTQMMENKDSESTIQDLNKIVKEWEPKLATVTLFIRWSQHGRRHFNNDSISVLYTMAQQCNFNCMSLLNSFKTYYFISASQRRMLLPFGFQFHFAKTKGLQPSYCSKIGKALNGLKLSIAYLHNQVECDHNLMGSIGMKRKAPDNDKEQAHSGRITRKFYMEQVVHESLPLFRCHTPKAFGLRLWKEIEHRFLAFHVVKGIFQHNLDQRTKDVDYLAYSFMTLSPCKERSDFIDVLARICLQCKDKNIIIAIDFRKLWSHKHEYPQGLYKFSQHYNESQDLVVFKIQEIFSYFRSMKTNLLKYCSSIDNAVWWNTICANVYRHWLDLRKNDSIKDKLKISSNTCSQSSTSINLSTQSSKYNQKTSNTSTNNLTRSDTLRELPNILGLVGMCEIQKQINLEGKMSRILVFVKNQTNLQIL